MPSTTTNPSPSTTLTTETDLSILYRVLRTVIKPLRPRLTQPGKPLPGGSPRLTDHPKSKKGCQIVERQDPATKLWLYDFKPAQQQPQHNSKPTSTDTTRPKHEILYFAGGGFQSPPSGEHWSFVSTLASHSSLSHIYNFTLVSYPLAPNSPASASLPVLQTYLRSVIEDAATRHARVSLMGDSAGGNVALSLGFWWSDQLSRLGGVPAISVSAASDDDVTVVDGPGHTEGNQSLAKRLYDDTNNDGNNGGGTTDLSPVLTNVFAISPAVDMTNSNPEIQSIDKYDPILGSELTTSVAKAWTSSPPSPPPSSSKSKSKPTTTTAHTATTTTTTQSTSALDPKSPLVSPLYNTASTFTTFKSLSSSSSSSSSSPSKSSLRIHGVIGTHDVLAPDAELFRRKCVDADIPGEWLVWEGQMHCFVLAGVYGMSEGRKGVQWCVDVLKRNV